jgi:nitrite reductase/ring-hydroxylating ferredoxin subunit
VSEWFKVAEPGALADGRVTTAVAGHRTVALCRVGARYGALDNHCPHQGGPLGEGAIEKGWLRCPWHGYDYDPITGRPPAGFSDAPEAFDVEVREDGIYVRVPQPEPPARTVSDVLVETMVAWGVTTPTSASPRHCAARTRRATCVTSASGTRAPRRSPPPPTGN